MDHNESQYNRRDFLRGSSLATLTTMLGGVELLAQAEETAEGQPAYQGPQVKVGVIGLGAWGREILTTLACLRADCLNPKPEGPRLVNVVAICDNYPAFLTRAAKFAPGATQVPDYKAILGNKEIAAVIIATPTHLHKEIAIAALKAGKHVYCEAPLASTIEDAREIALAAKAATRQVFQAGLQMRADSHRHFIVKNFIRPGATGYPVMARAQWHKKTSWRAASPNPEREKALNWRLDKSVSLGLIGEVGIHPIDQVMWYLNALPTAVTGFGSTLLYKDGRDVPDTIQAMIEFPAGVNMVYDASLASSFDSEYEVLHGTYAAIMARDHKAWLFKEADSPLLGWEIYSKKENFYNEIGIVLSASASKSVQAKPSAGGQAPPPGQPGSGTPAAPAPGADINTSLADSLERFLKNTTDLAEAIENTTSLGIDDPKAFDEQLSKTPLKPTGGYLEGFRSVVMAVKANEAILAGKRVEIKRELYEL